MNFCKHTLRFKVYTFWGRGVGGETERERIKNKNEIEECLCRENYLRSQISEGSQSITQQTVFKNETKNPLLTLAKVVPGQ